jgi:DHA2 family multidrug resistance protein-like MFS transporter
MDTGMTAGAQTGTPAPRAGRREWMGLAVLALPTLLLALDLSVMYLALPLIGEDLSASGTQLLWIMDIYGFMIAGWMVTMGTLGDRIGRRRLLMAGAAAFGLASVLAAYAANPEMMIATRAAMGVAGATLMPSTLGMITNMFADPRQRGIAIATWVSCFMSGAAFGPVIAGLLLEYFWWGSVFLLGVPVMVVLLIVGPLLLPPSRAESAERLDLVSVALSLATILPVIYALKEFAREGVTVSPVVALVAGVAFGTLFAARQRRLAHPLVDLRLFGNRSFRAALAMMLLGIGAMGGIGLFFTQYLQLVQDLSPLKAGLCLVPSALGVVAGSMLAPGLARKFGAHKVVAGALAVSACGFVVLALIGSSSGIVVPVLGYVLAFLGLGPMSVLGNELVVGSVPPSRAGSAAALSGISSDLGIALGVAVLGSIGTAVYRTGIGDGVPAGAKEGLSGAVSAAGKLPGSAAASLLDDARDAFMRGFNVAALVSAATVLVLASLALVRLRGTAASADAESPAAPAAQPEDAESASAA